ncbi:MAG: acyl-CoA/acyl-ACP dehydrogenase [Porticoccaceae bacterium]|nr:acyl-CoA/acyl-ACP dehydrogenase [Porticoccaceae bacterium]
MPNIFGCKMLGLNKVYFARVRIGDEQRLAAVKCGWQCIPSGLMLERIVTSAGMLKMPKWSPSKACKL